MPSTSSVIATANTPSENDSSRLVDIAEGFAGRGPDPVVQGVHPLVLKAMNFDASLTEAMVAGHEHRGRSVDRRGAGGATDADRRTGRRLPRRATGGDPRRGRRPRPGAVRPAHRMGQVGRLLRRHKAVAK